MSDDAADRLRHANRRLGRARRLVIEALASQPGPVTAEQLATLLPDVHASSVYRSLHVLEELGSVRHIHLAHGPALYEPTERVSSVRHAVCEVCGHSFQIPTAVLDQLRRRVERDYGFVLDSDHFALPGRCAGCSRE
jgi:Fur family ferric uptake transcriptional regulator